MKEIVLGVYNVNWGMKGPGDWEQTMWKIYNDFTVDVKVWYNSTNENEKNKSYNFSLTQDEYNDLISRIQLLKENNEKIEAEDGDAWEVIQYNDGSEVWRRDLGYIYGITPFEEISKILNNLLKK